MVEDLLKKFVGEDVTGREESIREALLPIAAALGDQEAVRNLLEKGTQTEARHSSMTPLMIAAEKGDLELVKLLVEHGADIDACQRDKTSISLAAQNGHVEIVRYLQRAGASLNTWTGNNHRYRKSNILIDAAERGEEGLVRDLLDGGADVNFVGTWQFDENGGNFTALSAALENGHLELAEFLVSKGADPNRGRILVCEVQEGNARCVEWLLAAGADEGLSDALSCASSNGYLGMVELLLEHGADPNPTDPDRLKYSGPVTPLMCAAEQGYERVVKILLEHGANPSITNVQGQTALDLAISDEVKVLLTQAMGTER